MSVYVLYIHILHTHSHTRIYLPTHQRTLDKERRTYEEVVASNGGTIADLQTRLLASSENEVQLRQR